MLAHPVFGDALTVVVGHDTRATVMLVLDESSDLVPAATGREADDALIEARVGGLVVGCRGEGDGSVVWWSGLGLSISGLRLLGEWPPPGRPREPGLREDGYWGRRARPLLRRLSEAPPEHGFYLKPLGGGLDWTALQLLLDAGLASGQIGEDGIDTLRVTLKGYQALDQSAREPLDVAEARLRSGARVDAMVTAIEQALVPWMMAIASERAIPVERGRRPVKPARLNADLRAAGVYGETDRAQVEA